MSAILSPLSSVRLLQPAALRSPRRALLLRLALMAGLVLSMAIAAVVSVPLASSAVEPELILLLRGMALIKAAIALAALALSLWRLGRPVSGRVALGYFSGVWSLAGATVLIWQLSFIPAAAIIFHAGMFGLLALAWREGRSDSLRSKA